MNTNELRNIIREAISSEDYWKEKKGVFESSPEITLEKYSPNGKYSMSFRYENGTGENWYNVYVNGYKWQHARFEEKFREVKDFREPNYTFIFSDMDNALNFKSKKEFTKNISNKLKGAKYSISGNNITIKI
jgi:hypothetical protein